MRRLRKTGIRLPEALCLKLEREAGRHRVSFNHEVQMRLEDSLENKDAPRALDAIQESMRVVWERYSNRLLMLNLEEEFVRKALQSTDTTVMALANTWLIHHARDRKLDHKWKELKWEGDPKRTSPLARTQKEYETTMRGARPRTRRAPQTKESSS